MSPIRLTLLLATLTAWLQTTAQTDSLRTVKEKADSLLYTLQELPKKYLTDIDNKIDKYTSRVTNKTEKTLTKLAKWEAKIKSLLEKASPETAQRLFSNSQLTFATALEKYKQGQSVVTTQRKKYNEYRDKLTTSIKYLEEQKEKLNTKLVQPLAKAKEKITEYETAQDESDATEQFIKDRKKQLIDQGLQYIGKSKYLQKINKEIYYYVETIKNYKQIFSDKQKAEETALTLLNKIPAFKKFVQENSMLASLFQMPGGAGNTPNLTGLQTRASVNALIQNQIASGGPNAAEQIRSNMQAAQAELSKLKDKVLKAGGSSRDMNMPDFKPNNTKTQTFKQRLEKGFNLQFGKTNSLVPTTADIGMNIGYKLNDKSVIGLGASYKMGMGSIQRISITHQGVGLRSYMDWQLKKQFYISGGYEMNRLAKPLGSLQASPLGGGLEGAAWQQSGLVGITKKIALKTKLTKGTKIQLLYDMLARQHVPVSQPVVFRVGYTF